MQPLTKKMKEKKFKIYQVGKSIKAMNILLDGKITSSKKGYKHF